MNERGENEAAVGCTPTRAELAELARAYEQELYEEHWIWVFDNETGGSNRKYYIESRLDMLEDALGADDFCAAVSAQRRKWDAILRDAEDLLKRRRANCLTEIREDDPEVWSLCQRADVKLHCVPLADLQPMETLPTYLEEQSKTRIQVEDLLTDLDGRRELPPSTPN